MVYDRELITGNQCIFSITITVFGLTLQARQ